MKHLLTTAAAVIFACTVTHASTYYLNSSSGNDTTGSGTAGNPWQTVDKAKATVTPGDSVILAGGTYAGYLDINATPNTGWITWQSAPGETAHFDTLNIGHQWDEEQQADKYIRFVNIAFKGKVFIRYSRYVEISGCTVGDVVELIAAHHISIIDCDITSFEPHAFTYEAVRESGVGLGTKASAYCTNIRIEGCHIHNIGGAGIGARGDSITIKDNHIHSTANDGLILTNVRYALIEGNLIHDCDDGLFDGDTTDYYAIFYPDIPRDSTYRIGSMHTDGIHMRCDIYYTDGKPDLVKSQEYACRNIVFRGNTVYDVEAQGVILQGLPRRYTVIEGTDTTYIERTAVHPKNLLWENNVFGVTNGTMFYANHPIDTLVFRNNTVVYFPEGRDYVSSWRTIHNDNHNVTIVDGCTETYVYNNMMVNVPGNMGTFNVYDYNLFRVNTQNEPLPRFSLLDTVEQFNDPDAMDGILLSTSIGINAGTGTDGICPHYPAYGTDKYGTSRDIRPDMGAYELPGQNPDPEPQPYTGTEEKTIFIDDFADLNFDHDVWLDSNGIQGLAWTQAMDDSSDYEIRMTAGDIPGAAAEVYGNGGPALLLADQHRAWKEFSWRFTASNPGVKSNDGLVVLAQDTKNFYHIDLSRETGRVVRYMDGIGTELDTSDAIETNNADATGYLVTVTAASSGITISVDKDADGSDDFTMTDTDAAAIDTFARGGRIGLYHNYDVSPYHRIAYSTLRAEVTVFGDTLRPSSVPLDNAGTGTLPSFALSSRIVTECLTVTTDGYTMVSVHDASGTEIIRNRRGQKTFVWDASHKPSGVYYVRALNGTTVTVKKIIHP